MQRKFNELAFAGPATTALANTSLLFRHRKKYHAPMSELLRRQNIGASR